MIQDINNLSKNYTKIKKEHFGSLDGLRAYAALGIVLMHVLANIKVKPSINYLTEHLIPFFTNFTLLFMMISGFSLCCGYYQKIKDGTITPNNFYRKRYLRILPFFAILCFLDFAMSPSVGSMYEVFSNLTLCFGLLPSTTEIHVIGVGWFLGIVFLFYMLFPFFVFMLDNKRRAWISLSLVLIFAFISFEYYSNPGRRCMIYCAPLFVIGGMVYLYRRPVSEFIKSNFSLACIITIILTICYFIFKDNVYNPFIYYVLELLLFTLWLLYAIGSKDVVLNNKVVKYLSNISMEIYLAHMVIYRAAEKVHLENYIEQNDILYIITALLTIIGVICFAHIMKFYIVNKILDKIERMKGVSC